MNHEEVLSALERQGKPVIRHKKTNASYYLRDILRVNISGEWFLGATYFNNEELFCRGLSDFGGFDYIHNEIS
jgi:hypothetical protein